MSETLRPPVFYTDPIYDPIHGTWIPYPESKTVEPKVVQSIKLCPFRKRTIFQTTDKDKPVEVSSMCATYMEEDFLPCIKEECMLYNGQNATCGRK